MTGIYPNESVFKKEVCRRLEALGWLMEEHEDMYRKFIADLSFAAHGKDGWIEVKYLKSPPKTLNDIKHYTMGQQEWLIEKGSHGSGYCYLLVGVQDGGIFAWRWDVLRRVRHADWTDAGVLAIRGGLGDVLRGLNAVVLRGRRG